MHTNKRLLEAHWQEASEVRLIPIWEALRQATQLLVITCGCVLAYVMLWPSFEKSERLKREIESHDEMISKLETQRIILEEEYYALLHNPEAVEREARDLLNLAREGETIFRFVPYEQSPAIRAPQPR